MTHYAIVTESGDLKFEFEAQQRAYCLARYGAGGCVDVDVREHRDKRSDRQNRALWALLTEWCRQADQGWRPDDLKDAVMAHVFGTLEMKQPLTGEIVRALARPHTSTLNVTEFCAVIEAILELAAHQGVYLLAPDEFRQAKDAAAKKKKAA